MSSDSPQLTLADFIREQRSAIIERTHARVAHRASQPAADVLRTDGVPVFLDHLDASLRFADRRDDEVPNPDLVRSAGIYGLELFKMGLSIAQVVRAYGDVCQAVTELAVELRAPIRAADFQTLNLCLDDAIAEAVTEYASMNKRVIAAQEVERLGDFGHELRNLIGVATLSFDSITTGRVPAAGSTARIHGRTLSSLRDLVDRSLADVRLEAGIGVFEAIAVADLLDELEISGMLQAERRGIVFSVESTDREVWIDGDRQTLLAAISNLLQNAFKFTPKQGKVSLRTRAAAGEISFQVEDECGGLPPGDPEDLFVAYSQRGANRAGIGLGLSISRRAAKANRGDLRVVDVPGKGCIFTLSVPCRPASRTSH